MNVQVQRSEAAMRESRWDRRNLRDGQRGFEQVSFACAINGLYMFKGTLCHLMAREASKAMQRPFPWRETLLAALRRDPRMNLACKAAHISRNTAYQHLRNDGRFR